MTRTILILSGKGGVGKTTLVSNLAYALSDLNEDVIAMDANLTTPNLGLHTGMPLTPRTLHDALKGNAELGDVVYKHPYGFRIIPASMSMDDLAGTDPSKLSELTMGLLGKTDYVLIDSAAGLGREAVGAINAADEVLIVVNPSMPSIVDAFKAAELTRKLGRKVLGVVVNRRSWASHEMSSEQIESMIEAPILAEIPEDENVARSIALKQSIFEYNRRSPAAIEITRLAHTLSGRRLEYSEPARMGMLQRFVNWLTR